MAMKTDLNAILKDAGEKRATDVHICADAPVLYRIGKNLEPATEGKLTAEESRALALSLLTQEQATELRANRDFDCMWTSEQGRFRVNINFNNGNLGAVIRLLPREPRSIEELRLPPVVRELAHRTKGLVLITGSASQGKTTTLSAMVDEINRTERKNIVTIEDPVEYVHTNNKSIVRQREVGRDTKSFASGLRAALRQDPDVIAIGEMRDYDTIRIALTAAETGSLVLSTLHIISIDKIIERLLSYAPQEDERHVKYLLADCLQGVIHQELLPTVDGGKRAACEVLTVTYAAKNIIRGGRTFFLRTVIATGAKDGMITMKQSLEKLVEEKSITQDLANGVLANYES